MSKVNKYNIYKIRKGLQNNLVESLIQAGYEFIQRENCDIKATNKLCYEVYYLYREKSKKSNWILSIEEYTGKDLNYESIGISGGVVLCSNNEYCFAISYGAAYYILNKFSESRFGIDIAERILNLDKIKSVQNTFQGRVVTKSLIDYKIGSFLQILNGEVPVYFKGEPLDKNAWGKTLQCGSSVMFKWSESLDNIDSRLINIIEVLKQKPKRELPSLLPLSKNNPDNKKIIEDLEHGLEKALLEYNEEDAFESYIGVPSFFTFGTNIFQNRYEQFTLTYNKRVLYENQNGDELSIELIRNLYKKCKCKKTLMDFLRTVKISFITDHGTHTEALPIINYLEYMSKRYCLQDGHWCEFNQMYLNNLHEIVNKITCECHINDEFSCAVQDVKNYILHNNMSTMLEVSDENAENNKTKKNNKQRIEKETLFNSFLAKRLGGQLVHPNTQLFDNKNKKYKIELCDVKVLTPIPTFYFVKIGTAADFAEAIIQAETTLKYLETVSEQVNTESSVEYDFVPEVFSLVLIFNSRKNLINKISDIESIRFLINLSILNDKLLQNRKRLRVDFVYFNL